MDVLTGFVLLLAFLVVVVLIIRGQSPIIMLLVLAIVWAAVAGVGIGDIQAKVLQNGGVAYASAVIIIVFGAWFAQILIQTGIAESVIRSAVELAGDRPLVTAMVINLVTALLFTSMYGVGAAIAIGVIALPIMMSQGIPPRVAAPAFTMGIGAGTFVNLVQFGTFQKLFPGIAYTA
ncbi:MAG: gluconate:proton symporter, partial [Alphaproteobacteria bacterium]|nr:gluconate:proton symporter [Alphaproteobacteria bacterium]